MKIFKKLNNRSVMVLVMGILLLVIAITFTGVLASPTQQAAGQTVTLTGYVTKYLDDDEVMFTDGTNTVKLELKNAPASSLPVNTPLTITVQIVEPDDGGFEVNLVSVDKTGESASESPAGPNLPIKTVAEIQASPVNDQPVVIRGQITQHLAQLGRDKYLFSDGTGMIVLDVDDDVPQSAVPLNQQIIVFGQIDVDDGRV